MTQRADEQIRDAVQQAILDELRSISGELREIRQAVLAERQMLPDPTTGEMTRSRAIVRRTA